MHLYKTDLTNTAVMNLSLNAFPIISVVSAAMHLYSLIKNLGGILPEIVLMCLAIVHSFFPGLVGQLELSL